MPLTPMMQQYMEIKEQYKDCILFFRLGDFYEMFFDDAITASKAMEVTLTGKSCGLEERAPMCGVPYHAVDTYVARLIEKGFKVAICEQLEDPAACKGIVKRDVVQVITPGTLTSGNLLKEEENNYLAAVFAAEEQLGFAYCDISTGEMAATVLEGPDRFVQLEGELSKTAPRELLLPEEQEIPTVENYRQISGLCLSPLPEDAFDLNKGRDRIRKQFNTLSLESIGLSEEGTAAEAAVAALLHYLSETQKQDLSHLSGLKVYQLGSRMALDRSTIKNLELTETLFEKKINGSLLGVLDKTHTAMGSRKMKQWIRKPLNRLDEIKARLDGVEALGDGALIRNHLKESLKRVYDLERLAGRMACGNANARDMLALGASISALQEIKQDLPDLSAPILARLEEEMDPLEDVRGWIHSAIAENPPYIIREGGLIKRGYSEELDDLKDSIVDGQQWIAGLEATERERTGIRNLKVGFNKVFGYYIEVSKSNLAMVPDNYIRKQTLVGGERFITPELKEKESLVLNAETKINQLEYRLFQELRERIRLEIGRIQRSADAVAELDVLCSFAEVSVKNGYVKPAVDDSDVIRIEKGRHPVIEQTIADGVFVHNDVYLDRDQQSLLLITGPNMSGKSTYMRQTALIVLMAQMGCFVPAERARIGLVDRIYTRIGASDNLAMGQSTFFVEMSELAHILNTATDRSLVLLDEIGRGTSTYDGLSIAWAAAEYLCRPGHQIRGLFATHYHEMTVLEEQLPGLMNYNVDVEEQGGSVVFLHKIVPGSASRSYGIHVAKLAGVPKSILERAQEKLAQLEREEGSAQEQSGFIPAVSDPASGQTCARNGIGPAKYRQEEQLSFFRMVPDPVLDRLKSLDLMEITPSKAFEILEELQKAALKG